MKQLFMVAQFWKLLVASILSIMPCVAVAECNISEMEDRFIVVCTGIPLTAAEKQALMDEEKRRQDAVVAAKNEAKKKELNIVVANRSPLIPNPKLSPNNKENLKLPKRVRDNMAKFKGTTIQR